MKTFTFIITFLFAIAIKANAQIPNAGFEDWDSYPNYLDPVDFLTSNSLASTSYYPVTRSADHFPSDVGSYSIRFENNMLLVPNIDGFGFALQNSTSVLLDGPGPSFPIVGHPTSLTGYYKYFPQNDTMRITVILFKNGVSITGNSITSKDSAADWTSFTIPIPNYTSADSGSILIAAYNADGYPPEYQPRGNSILYIDNLNFDNLITSTQSSAANKSLFKLYPNPASEYITVNVDATNNSDKTLNIYNIIGGIVKTEKIKTSREKIDISNLTSGVYMLEIKSGDISEKQKLIIQ